MLRSFTVRVPGWLASLLVLLVTTSLQAQVTTRQLPGGSASLNQFGAFGSQGTIPTLELAQLDVARLKLEDEQYQKTGRPLRVAIVQSASVDIPSAGAVSERNGYRVYQYQVLAPGAGALSAKFDRLQLAAGAQLFIYNAAQTQLVGPITSQQNTDGLFSTGHVTGDRLIIELQEPVGVAGQSQLHLMGIANFYDTRGPFGGLRPAGACENNQACFPAYQTEADGVALILVDDGAGGQFLCTGTTVNDARQSFRSFFLTAFHCIDFDADQVSDANERNSTPGWLFYFKYQSATCTPNQDDNVYVTLSGATYRAGSAASDFTLVELNAQAPQSENISFVGWDRSSNLASSVFGIHHPNGSLKKISFGGATTTVGVTYGPGGGYNTGPGTSFLQLSWNDGVTEGGSSGSALFDGSSRRIIGQLLGGSSFCTPASAQDDPDQYGRFFTSWTGGGSNETRLSNWLDPTGVSTNTTNLAVPLVSGPASFTGSGTFGLNTGTSSIVSWVVSGGSGAVSPATGSGSTANLTALTNASNLTITFSVSAGQSYAIQFTKTFSVSVAAPVNTPPSPPAGGIPNQTATVGTAFSYVVPAFTDPDAGQTLTYSATGLPANGLSFNAATRTVSGTPSTSGTVGVTITANDGNGGSTPASFTITINPAIVVPPTNNPPVAPAIGNQTATVGVAYFQNTPSFTDPDGQAIAVQAFNLPPGLTYTGTASGIVAGTPTTAGVYSVSLVGTDLNNGTISGGLSATAVYTITVSPASPGGGALTLLAPTYNCTTGAFTFNTSGGNGTPVSFSAVGITGPTTNPNQFVDQGLRTAADAPLITLSATQSGVTVTYVWNIRAVCPLSPGGGALTLLAPTYNCATGAFTFNTSGGDGSPVSFSAVGITGPTFNPNQFVDAALRNAPDAPLVTLSATQSGVTVTYVWNIRAVCPLSPGGGALTLLAPTYNCATGAFTFNTSGGNGTPVSFSAIGITGPTTNPNQFVDEGSRTANDVQPFLLSATQSGVTVTLLWDLKAACGRARVGVEPLAALKVSVLGNPVVGETVDVDVTGAENQPLRIQLTTLQGQLVSGQQVKQAAALERVRLQLNRSAGVYLLQVSSPGQTKVVRVLRVN